MIIIGLDLSLLGTAVCVLSCKEDDFSFTTQMLRGDKSVSIRQKIERLDSVSNRISSIVRGFVLEDIVPIIVIEAPAKNQKWQAAAIGEIHAAVKLTLYREFGIIPEIEEATKIRKVVVGEIKRSMVEVEILKGKNKGKKKKKVSYGMVTGKNGKLKPATVKDIVEERLKEKGFSFETQDEMDSFACSYYMWLKLRSSNARIK